MSICPSCKTEYSDEECIVVEDGCKLCINCGLVLVDSVYPDEHTYYPNSGKSKHNIDSGYQLVKSLSENTKGKEERTLIWALMGILNIKGHHDRVMSIFETAMKKFKYGKQGKAVALCSVFMVCREERKSVSLAEIAKYGDVEFPFLRRIYFDLRRCFVNEKNLPLFDPAILLDRLVFTFVLDFELRQQIQQLSLKLYYLLKKDMERTSQSTARLTSCFFLIYDLFHEVEVPKDKIENLLESIGSTAKSLERETKFVIKQLYPFLSKLPWIEQDCKFTKALVIANLLEILKFHPFLDLSATPKAKSKRKLHVDVKEKIDFAIKRLKSGESTSQDAWDLAIEEALILGCSKQDIEQFTFSGLRSWISGKLSTENVDDFIRTEEETNLIIRLSQ